jgi:hypothetical protein
MQLLGQLGQEQEQRGYLREGPTVAGTIGAMVADPLNLFAAGSGRVASRVANKIGQSVARETAQATAGRAARTVGSMATDAGSILANDSVGASQATTRQGFAGLMDMIFEPGELTAQQRALIPVGERVGFKFLPGQKDGNRLFLDSLQSHPITSQAFSYELGANADTLRTLVMKSLNLEGAADPANFSREILRQSRREVGQRFEDVRQMMPEGSTVALSEDGIGMIDDLKILKPAQRRAFDLNALNPEQAFETRSRLNAKMNDFYRAGESQAGDDLSDIIEQLDMSIGDQIGPEGLELWRTARQQWRVRLALKRPGVITPDGDVSLKALSNNLEKQFEREFGETLLPDDAFRQSNPAIADLMDFTRVSRSFASNLPDSGTATRQTVGRILSGNWKEIAAAAAVRKLVEGSARLQ